MTPRLLVACTTLLALATLLGACGDDEPAASETSTEATSNSTIGDEGDRAGDSVSIEMLADRFSPSTTEVAGGETVAISLANTSEFEHTFTIDDAEVDETLEPGARAEVVVDVPQDGSLAFYCRFHVEIGMEGTVVAGGGPSPDPSAPSTTTVTTEPEPGGYGY